MNVLWESEAKIINCLYNFSRLLKKEKNDMEKILKETIKLLPPSLRYPEDACVCITFKGHEFKTRDYQSTPWEMSAHIESYSEHVGTIEVGYAKPHLQEQDRFVQEERLMLETIAEHLGLLTEQIQAKEDLQKSKNQLSTTLHSIGDAVIATDTKGKITLMNTQAEKITGWAAEEALGKELHEVFIIANAITGEPVSNPVYRVINTGGTQALPGDTVLITRDGTKRHISDSAAPIRDHKDNMFGVIMVFSDITERKNAEEKVRYQSFHDILTGLYNRVYLEKEMERLDTERQLPNGIIMADVNGLKKVNDTYGHEMGDEMLKQAAEIIKKSCRKEDIIARWGGDEFVIFLPHTTEEEANLICQRIDRSCKETYIKDVPLSLALGIAIKTSSKKSLAETMKEADDNMYKNKFSEREHC